MNARVMAWRGRAGARRAAQGSWTEGAARAGLTARGVIYLLVGVLALRIAFGGSGRQADRGALAELAARPFGALLLWALGAGLAGMALWRLSEAVSGAVGKDGRGARKRLTALARCGFYTCVAWSVLAFAADRDAGGGSSDRQSRDVTARALEAPAGQWLVGAAGLVIVGAGCWIGVQAARRTYHKKLKLGELSRRARRLLDVSGVGGGVARGLVFAAAGVFAVRAALAYEPDRAKGMDDTCAASPQPRWARGCWSASPRAWCCSACSPSRWPAGGASEAPDSG